MLALRRAVHTVRRSVAVAAAAAERTYDAFADFTERIGVVMITVFWALVAYVVVLYFSDIAPLAGWSDVGVRGGASLHNAVTLFGISLLLHIVYYHVRAIRTPAGPLPAALVAAGEPPHLDRLLAQESAATASGRKTFGQYCRVCRRVKPPRAHHCSMCGRCVMRMDHHCPWIDNCVGHGNYRYFFLFMLSLCVGCVFIMTCCGVGLARLYDVQHQVNMHNKQHRVAASGTDHSGGGDASAIAAGADAVAATLLLEQLQRHRKPVVRCVLLCFPTVLGLVLMMTLHAYLSVTNQSTIEMYFNRDQRARALREQRRYTNPFDLGSPLLNVEQLFGRARWVDALTTSLSQWCGGGGGGGGESGGRALVRALNVALRVCALPFAYVTTVAGDGTVWFTRLQTSPSSPRVAVMVTAHTVVDATTFNRIGIGEWDNELGMSASASVTLSASTPSAHDGNYGDSAHDDDDDQVRLLRAHYSSPSSSSLVSSSSAAATAPEV